MRCYQCEEPAFLCEKPTNRLFCAKNHHTLYHESWTDLLKHVNAQPLAKRLILGMKREHDDDDKDETTTTVVVTIQELEYLPDDIMMEVLLYTFPDFGRDLKQTKAAFKAREAAQRIKRIIDQFIIGVVTEISDEVLELLTNESLLLFKGVKTLSITSRKTKITDEGLCKMTWLEKLEIANPRLITIEGIKGLGNLKTLVLKGNKNFGDDALKVLPQLTHLTLDHQKLITDVGIGYLINLQSLDIGSCKNIRGTTFGSLSRLVNLRLGYKTNVNDDNLMLLGDFLEELKLGRNKKITERGLSKMRRLRKLDVTNCDIEFTSAALDACTESLEVVFLNEVDEDEDDNNEFGLKWDALSKCRNLKRVYLFRFAQLRATETQAVLEQERGIEFIFY